MCGAQLETWRASCCVQRQAWNGMLYAAVTSICRHMAACLMGASSFPLLCCLASLQLDEMLDLAACQIVSFRSNAHFDAYVLSESSLFVYPDRMVSHSICHCHCSP